MTDQLISFETAKLAKEKGFVDNEDSHLLYDSYGKPTVHQSILSGECYPRITQSLLQKWLREKHNLHVNMYYRNFDKTWLVDVVNMTNTSRNHSIQYLENTYEEALEQGLIESLKIII